MNTIKISGYDHGFRFNLIKGVILQFDKTESLVNEGTRVKFRSRKQILDAKSTKLGKFNNTWFLRGEVQNTLKCPFTPGAGLKEALQVQVDTTFKDKRVAGGGATKVVELGGRPIWAGLSSHQKFGGQTGCQFGRVKCLASLDSDCRITRAVYKTICVECKESSTSKPSEYVGTTGRTVHSRSLEHQAALRKQNGSSALSVHQALSHPGKEPRFETSIIRGGMRFNTE